MSRATRLASVNALDERSASEDFPSGADTVRSERVSIDLEIARHVSPYLAGGAIYCSMLGGVKPSNTATLLVAA